MSKIIALPSAPLTGDALAKFREEKAKLDKAKVKAARVDVFYCGNKGYPYYDKGLRREIRTPGHRREVCLHHPIGRIEPCG